VVSCACDIVNLSLGSLICLERACMLPPAGTTDTRLRSRVRHGGLVE
jgi:hypothetical protein